MRLDELRDDKERLLLDKAQRAKLEGMGIVSVELLAQTPLRAVLEGKGIGELKAAQVLEAARKAVLSESFVQADEWLRRKREKTEMLTSGSKSLDKLIGGGFRPQELYEVAGTWGSGKTQLCMQLCVNACLPKSEGGLGGDSLYFATEDNFKEERVLQMAGNNMETLSHIIRSHCYSSDHQACLLETAAPVIEKYGIRLLVVDSLIVHFRSEYHGREKLAERQQCLGNYLMRLHRLARAYNLVVVYSNQAIANPQAFGPSEKEAGGNVVGHQASARLWIRQKGRTAVRIARLTKSPWLAEGECLFAVTERGITDVEGEETVKEEIVEETT